MKVINPKCLCRDCKFQMTCRNHSLGIRIQSLAKYLGKDFSTICVRMVECKKFIGYSDE